MKPSHFAGPEHSLSPSEEEKIYKCSIGIIFWTELPDIGYYTQTFIFFFFSEELTS